MDDIESIIGFAALYESMMKCKRNVIWKDSVAFFRHHAVEQVIKLSDELKSGTYTPRTTKKFTVLSPKQREVMGVAFRDRVYQRSLNDNAIYPQMTRRFIYDNAACQKKRGTDFARGRLHCFLDRFYRKHGLNGYVLQCDIKGYYPNMKHSVVESEFERHLTPEVFEMAKGVLLCQYEGDTGYYPGSQMIQIAGISVLNDLDHFIKEQLGIKHYIRYMDDFILIHESREYLEECRQRIEAELKKLEFELHPKKTKIYEISKPIKFLGFYHQLTDTGKIVILIDPKNVKNERLKLRRMANKVKRGELTREKVDTCYQSWRNHASRGNSYNLLKRMDAYYKSLWDF